MRTVTDRFSLVEKIRKYTPQNNRKYILESVNSTFSDPLVLERIKLGEMFGYFGHGRRAMNYERTGVLDLPETCIIMVDGKPVLIENVPSNRTLDIGMDDSGIVTHTQEIMDTVTGDIVNGMEKAKAGGWSWATGGDDQTFRTFVNSYHGMDYVNNPNYISLDKQNVMFESAESRSSAVIKGLTGQGFSEQAAIDIAGYVKGLDDLEPASLIERNAMLESALAMEEIKARRERNNRLNTDNQLKDLNKARQQRQQIMLEAVNNMPVFLSAEQRKALVDMETEEDARIVAAILESIVNAGNRTLPIGRDKEQAIIRSTAAVKDDTPMLFKLR